MADQHTFVGNLTADIDVKYTQNGIAVGNLTIAVNKKKFDKKTNAWVEQEPLYMRGSVWREQAEQAAKSLKKGTRVIAVGELEQRSFETQAGEKRTVIELQVQEIGPALRFATAEVTRTEGKGQGGAPQQAHALPQQAWAAPQQAVMPQQGGFPNEPTADVWGAPGTQYASETPF